MPFGAALCCGLATAGVAEVAVFSLGFLAVGIYDYVADKSFKGGDIVDKKLREIIVRNSNQIKSKIDCLSLKDLKTSYSHFCVGVELLKLACGTSNEDQKASEATGSTAAETTRLTNDTASDSLKSAFIELLQLDSKFVDKDRFRSAQEYFKDSRRASTNACNNKGLRIKDRIMAFQLRMAATVLETGLEDPEAAITACRITLKELHDLPEVQVMFSVFFKGGWRSRRMKRARLENMKSVLLLNYALVFFAFKHLKCRNYPFLVNLFKNWPVINLPGRTFHPIRDANQIPNMYESFVQPTFEAFNKAFEKLSQRIERVIEDSRILTCKYFAVNSLGDIILLLTRGKIAVIHRTGESKDIMLPQDNSERYEMDKGLAVDNSNIYDGSKDNIYHIYVVRLRGQRHENERREYVLYVIDNDGNIVNAVVLHFLDARAFKDVQIAVDQIGNIVIIKEDDNQVYICDDTGQLKSKFKRDGVKLFDLDISAKNEIMIVSDDRSAVHMYKTEGNVVLEFTLEVPKGHKAGRVAFHHRICKIIVLAHFGEDEDDSWVLLYYSETGKLENSVIFRKSEEIWRTVNMTSPPSGSFAVRCRNSVTFINN